MAEDRIRSGPGEHLDPGGRATVGEQQPREERFVRERAEPPAPETDPAAPADQAEPEDEVARLRAQVAELEDRWRRTAAELDNLRKRVARDSERQRLDERGRVAAAWLPVVDNLDLALTHADADPGSIVQGIRAVRDQALTVLAGLGYPRRDDHGVAFDPTRHEAVSTRADTEAKPGTVVEVLRPGYGDADRQLRPATVVVAARAADDGSRDERDRG
ncbi:MULTISPECIES: nucleotide exchange factor GrpE [Actinomycetes]|uniref:Protein GrpE n=2 Tax=Amycolatopsis TaxID=1813 RepID=A0A8E1W9Q5_9PSEU|nr:MULTISPECIES: nucleotide exchange factor GrpE [Actinomycetes]MBB2506467.1 nucleotide exchange factor GrpE [Amycolatopsis echigonensis]MBF6189384.1 nucleotide exchange factor GrpE [Nocardia farcinica]MBF6295615.1 nucleotide exchange factor GrpE [Nocardia farcinica]MBF6313357.1 nucleotide exchange factor GrpE [Nocardia farcinica]MBF6375426.1 nucleotide exchange factor GrpE [Nocardia farcinica]